MMARLCPQTAAGQENQTKPSGSTDIFGQKHLVTNGCFAKKTIRKKIAKKSEEKAEKKPEKYRSLSSILFKIANLVGLLLLCVTRICLLMVIVGKPYVEAGRGGAEGLEH